MFLPGLGRRAVKIIKMLAWDAHKLNRQVMYFKDILNISNTLIDILESITLSPVSFEARVSHFVIQLSITTHSEGIIVIQFLGFLAQVWGIT